MSPVICSDEKLVCNKVSITKDFYSFWPPGLIFPICIMSALRQDNLWGLFFVRSYGSDSFHLYISILYVGELVHFWSCLGFSETWSNPKMLMWFNRWWAVFLRYLLTLYPLMFIILFLLSFGRPHGLVSSHYFLSF